MVASSSGSHGPDNGPPGFQYVHMAVTPPPIWS